MDNTLPDPTLSPPDAPHDPSPTLRPRCCCGAESGRARRRTQGDVPCDGTWCASRRQEIEAEQSGREYLIRDEPGLPLSHTALYA